MITVMPVASPVPDCRLELPLGCNELLEPAEAGPSKPPEPPCAAAPDAGASDEAAGAGTSSAKAATDPLSQPAMASVITINRMKVMGLWYVGAGLMARKQELGLLINSDAGGLNLIKKLVNLFFKCLVFHYMRIVSILFGQRFE